MAEWDIGKLVNGLKLSLSAPEVTTNPDASQVQISVPQAIVPQAITPSTPSMPQAGLKDTLLNILQAGLIGAGAAGVLGEGSANFARINMNLMEQRRVKKASDETQALTGMISTALASGDPEQLTSVVQQLSRMKGLEPETIQSIQKVQMQLGEKLQTENRAKQVADFVGSLPGPQAQAVSRILNLNPEQNLAQVTNAMKDLIVDSTANATSFKSLPDKIKTQVFIEATDMKVDPEEFLKLARSGDPMARARLDRAVSALGAGQEMNAHDRMAVTMYGPRGVVAPFGARSFGELALVNPSAARQVMDEVKADEARAAALQKGILTEATLAAQLRMENAQPPKINQYWVDKDKLQADPGMPLNAARELTRPLGELRNHPERYTELDDQQRRQVESFNGIEAVLSEIEGVVPGLPKSGGLATLMNRAKNPVQRYLGTSGIANEVGTLQFGSLFLGRVFQGAASQLSDRDVAMAAYANITDGDSQDSIKEKIAIVRRLSRRFKLAMAGVDIRRMKPEFSQEEFQKAVSKFGAPSTPVPGTRAFVR